MSWVVVAAVFKVILSVNSTGVVNGALINMGLINSPIDFLGSSKYWTGTFFVMNIWKDTGWGTILFLATLSGISPDLYEAAQIDGATASQILFKIKIPMIMPSVTICTFLTLTNGFKMFDQNLSLTGGDPGKQSQLLALNIYDTFYGRSGPAWKGIGQAKAVVFFLLVVAIALIQLRATSSKEVQQ